MPLIKPAFWRGKRVLVTGHTGFKGAWLTMMLKRLGAEVCGVSLSADQPSLFRQAGIVKRVDAHYEADLRDTSAVGAIVSSEAPEIVIHMAAQALVHEAFRRPFDTFGTNVMGTVSLLEAIRKEPSVRAVLCATTDKVYLNSETGARFLETDKLGGIEPYSASKVGSEWVVAAYRSSYHAPAGVVALVARAGNIIGGGDWARDRLIPDAIRAAQQGKPLEVRNPASVRPWQFVLDALAGYLALIEKGLRHPPDPSDPEDGAFNFGPPQAESGTTVSEVCAWIEELWPSEFSWVTTPGSEPIKESKLLNLDSEKAFKRIGWRPRLSPREAVDATLNWYARVTEGEQAFAVSLEQIEVCLAHYASF